MPVTAAWLWVSSATRHLIHPPATSASGNASHVAGDDLAGESGVNVGKVKIRAWRGPEYINDPELDEAGMQ